jgi:hypothetical protein
VALGTAPNLLASPQSADATAQALVAEMDAMLQHPSHPLDPERVCFLIQNFGDHAWGGWSAFRHPGDAVDVDLVGTPTPDWPDHEAADPIYCGLEGNWGACHPEQFQPWQYFGRSQAGAWMQRCLETLQAAIQPGQGRFIEPFRFHFDSEIHLATTGNKNFPFLLRAMYLDDNGQRWNNTPLWPSGPTMATLCAAACAEFGPGFDANQALLYPTTPRDSNRWNATDGPQILNFSAPSTDPRYGFHERSHRDLFLWADPLFQQAVDYSMSVAAYERIHMTFGSDCLVSNCDDVTILREPATVSWMFDITGATSEECNSNPCPQFPRVWTRSFVRGESDKLQHGVLHQQVSSGRWLVRTGTRTRADFGSPVLYLMGDGNEIMDARYKTLPEDVFWADAYRQWDVFRKPLSGGLPPREAWFPSSMHYHERALDSAVASALEEGAFDEATYSPNLAPWTGMPDSLLLPYDSEDPPAYPLEMARLTHDDFSLQCSMLREKRIREFKTWDAEGFAPGTGGPHHQKLTTSWHQVWDPFIYEVTPIYGTVISPDAQPHRIEDTVPRIVGSALTPNTLDLVSQTLICGTCQPSSVHTVASFMVEFRGLEGGRNHGLRMRLENRVRNAMMEEGDRSFLPVGEIAFWRWTPNQEGWVCMPVSAEQAAYHATRPDDNGVTNGKKYRYWSLEDPPVGSLWYGTERDFRWPADVCAGLISPDGRAKVKLVLKHPGQFTAKWDLVQLAWTNDMASSIAESPDPEEEPAAMQGANVNHDDSIDEADITTFVDSYLASAAAADFDQDGEVTTADLVEFVAAFAEGGSP